MNHLSHHRPELICPAGTPACLRAAVDAGADAVYCGFQNETNARNFTGLNFTPSELRQGVLYAHSNETKVLLAINSFAKAGQTDLWKRSIEEGVRNGVDAIIVADIGMASYMAREYPEQRLHLSVQASAGSIESIKYYCDEFNIKRVVLPRTLAVKEIQALHQQVPCEIECFVFGNHGLMAEGRCSLTNYVTGLSTNMDGVCSPASHVQYSEDTEGELTTKLGDFTIDCFSCSQNPGYPTICKGRYSVPHRSESYYAFEEPVSINLAKLLPDLVTAGVTALKIEGRQRSSAYVKKVVSAWRKAIDAIMVGDEADLSGLLSLTEGQKQTLGAYTGKKWR